MLRSLRDDLEERDHEFNSVRERDEEREPARPRPNARPGSGRFQTFAADLISSTAAASNNAAQLAGVLQPPVKIRGRGALLGRCPVDHEGAKLDDAIWAAMPYVGIQPSIDEAGEPEELELRNCASCHTTLARLIPGGGE